MNYFQELNEMGGIVMAMNQHDFESNLKLSKETIKLRSRIRRFYELVFIGCLDIEQPSYDGSGIIREKQGCDTSIFLNDKIFNVQEKIRSPKYWNYRNKDLYIETKNQARCDGKGWLYHYKDNVDFIGWYFLKDKELSEIYFILYNHIFFEIEINQAKLEKEFNPHLQIKNGETFGETTGFPLLQNTLKECEVARFYFSNNEFNKIKKDTT